MDDIPIYLNKWCCVVVNLKNIDLYSLLSSLVGYNSIACENDGRRIFLMMLYLQLHGLIVEQMNCVGNTFDGLDKYKEKIGTIKLI